MSEDIQFQQVVIDRMVVEMGRRDIRRHIVRRMLYRRKFIDIVTMRKHDDTSRMLSGTSPYSGASLADPFDLAAAFPKSPLFIIIFDIAVCGLIRQRSDRSRFERMSLAEQNFRIFMSFRLIISGKVQVDIRLFVPFESKERLERNIKSGFHKRFAADRTFFIRHIESAAARIRFDFLGFKITVMAVRAVIMRTQRIYLGDPGHRRDKRRSDRTSGSNKISVVIGLPHQFLRDNIHHRISVGNNGIQFLFQTGRYLDRQIFPVNLVSAVITNIAQILLGIFDDRRAFIGIDRRDLLDHIRDLVRILDDDLLCFCRSQIFKFRQHLLGCPKIKRRLVVRIAEPFSRHDDPAVHLVSRIQKMYVARRNDRFFELFSQFHNLTVDIFQIFLTVHIRNLFALDHKVVVSKRLDLIIIVEIRKPCDRLRRFMVQDRLIQLSRLTGASDDKPVPVPQEFALRNPWHPGKILEMGHGNQTIQIHTSGLVFCQNHRMMRWELSDGIGIHGAKLVKLL